MFSYRCTVLPSIPPISLSIVSGDPPRFLSQPPSEVLVSSTSFTTFGSITANLVILCNVTGTPTPTVTWYREGNQIGLDSVINYTLVVNVTEGDGASRTGVRYHCQATNRIGGNNSIATVKSLTTFVIHKCKLYGKSGIEHCLYICCEPF